MEKICIVKDLNFLSVENILGTIQIDDNYYSSLNECIEDLLKRNGELPKLELDYAFRDGKLKCVFLRVPA